MKNLEENILCDLQILELWNENLFDLWTLELRNLFDSQLVQKKKNSIWFTNKIMQRNLKEFIRLINVKIMQRDIIKNFILFTNFILIVIVENSIDPSVIENARSSSAFRRSWSACSFSSRAASIDSTLFFPKAVHSGEYVSTSSPTGSKATVNTHRVSVPRTLQPPLVCLPPRSTWRMHTCSRESI